MRRKKLRFQSIEVDDLLVSFRHGGMKDIKVIPTWSRKDVRHRYLIVKY